MVLLASLRGTVAVFEAQNSRWVAGHDGPIGHIFGDHGAGPDDGVFAHPHRHDGAVGTEAGSVGDGRRQPLFFFRLWRHRIVDEHHTVADKNVAADLDEIANEGVALNPRAVANLDPFLDLDKMTDHAVATNLATVHIHEIPDFGAFADFAIAYELLFIGGVGHDGSLGDE